MEARMEWTDRIDQSGNDTDEAVHDIESDAPVEIFNEDVERDETDDDQLPCTSDHSEDELKEYDVEEEKAAVDVKEEEELEEGAEKIIIEAKNFREWELFFMLRSPFGAVLKFLVVNGEISESMRTEMNFHLKELFDCGLPIKKEYEKTEMWNGLTFDDVEEVARIMKALSLCVVAIVERLDGNIRDHVTSEWFKNEKCDSEMAKTFSNMALDRNMANARALNKGYKPFSNEVYGETSFDQIENILNELPLSESDVMVDMGSGVGNVIIYAAAYSKARRCIGIEVSEGPARRAKKIKKDFIEIMNFYGKRYRPFNLIHKSFLDDKFKKLITQVVVTSDMFLDVSKDITLAEFPCSWADGKNLRFQPFSINKEKLIRLIAKRVKEDEKRLAMKRAKKGGNIVKKEMKKAKKEEKDNEETKENGVSKKTVKAKGTSKSSRAVLGNSLVRNNSAAPRSIATPKCTTKQNRKKSVISEKEQGDGSFKYETAWMNYSDRTWEPRESFEGSVAIKMADDLDRFLDEGASLPKWFSDFKKKMEEEKETSSSSSRKVAKRKAVLDEVDTIKEDTNIAEHPLPPQTAYHFWMYLEGWKYGVTASVEWKKISDKTKWKEMEKTDKARHESEMKLYMKRKM
ncbi:hypothetical protein PRIPAC_97561 [Pristionchus pacificus]|uniref:Histone-lysine N-methyltransferase, H3 lysine-79 specific n=1 Tax=Pristionchus pacificus TaxID=54126 RepID=A0A2A6BBW2_PRIPA|nr:hypothetical protein PRIPAC_97561 [Pristionchus pacificus]|eukprot:PDM63358.1 hypothetical protein PRIPAC_53715 [Pristionchus pacificus]